MPRYGTRLSTLQILWRDGRLHPRRAESAFDGYGAPIYNYYEPGALFIVGIIDVLFTRDTVHPTVAVRFLYAMSLMLAFGDEALAVDLAFGC